MSSFKLFMLVVLIQTSLLISPTSASLIHKLIRGYTTIEGGWIAPFNGYKYKPTDGLTSWSESRRVCQSWGGDLAVYGIREFRTAETIMRAFQLNAWYWVGLSDIAKEGKFVWLNGNNQESSDRSMWHTQDPDNNDGADCVVMVFIPGRDFSFRLSDSPCTHQHVGICEKRV